MTPKRRALMFKVMDDKEEILSYLYHLNSFVRCDDILKWLIDNKLTGKEFLSWAKFHFGVSILELASFVLAQIDKHRKPGIFFGKDVLNETGREH